ncbi:MAG: HEPN domain-containing protein [Halobacteriota archaeon]|jgi:hypothetical protein
MMKEFSLAGLWRFPGKRKKWPGTLHYHPQRGASLELVGHAKEIYDLSASVMKRNAAGYQEIILGTAPVESANEVHFTLYECYADRPVFRPLYKGSLRLHFYVKTVIAGKHFTKSQELKFNTFLADFTHLFEWVDVSGITSGIDVPLDKLEDVDGLIIYKRPEPIKVSISNYTISLYFEREPQLEPLWGAKEQSCFKQRVYVMIEFAEKQSFETFEEVYYHFRNLLSLGVGHPVYPQEIKTRFTGKWGHNDVEFFVVNPHLTEKQQRLPIIQMLFIYADISARFETYLSNWMANSDRLKPVYDLYFGIIHNPDTYLIHTFLSLIQALETYHRRLAIKYELTDDVRGQLVQEVLNRSSRNYDASKLEDRIDPPLLMRLLELLKIHEDILHPIIEYWQHVQYAEFLKDARNYFTHLEPAKDSTAPTSDELWRANERMKLLLQTCLLFELGLNKNQIKQLFSRNADFDTLGRTLHTLSKHVISIPFYRL